MAVTEVPPEVAFAVVMETVTARRQSDQQLVLVNNRHSEASCHQQGVNLRVNEISDPAKTAACK